MFGFLKRKERGISTTEYERYPGSGACDVCNARIDPNEAFQVPTGVFWASKKYKEWIAHNPMTSSMLRMSGTSVDQYIAMQRAADQTACSAVCANCIHLFR